MSPARSIQNNVLVGLVLTSPIVATALIFRFIFRLATDWIPAAHFPRLSSIGDGLLLRILTLFAVLFALYLVGLLTRNFFGRRLFRIADKALARIPLIQRIYVALRNVSGSLFAQRETLFQEVVLIEYPRAGLYTLAFVTAPACRAIADEIEKKTGTRTPCVSIFIPTSPTPTSGVFISVPRTEITPLDIPVTDALTYVMSAGAVDPEQSLQRHDHIDRLDDWMRRDERKKKRKKRRGDDA